MSAAFELFIGIDYSGAQAPTSRLPEMPMRVVVTE